MKWSYFPRNQRITDDLLNVIDVFNRNNNHINSSEHKLKSDEVLHSIANGLGRAVTNYQFLKDFFESCCMDDADYLCIAVRLLYRKNDDYKKVCEFFDAMYASNKFSIPLKGILIIGY